VFTLRQGALLQDRTHGSRQAVSPGELAFITLFSLVRVTFI
jgi:hypothetical protein